MASRQWVDCFLWTLWSGVYHCKGPSPSSNHSLRQCHSHARYDTAWLWGSAHARQACGPTGCCWQLSSLIAWMPLSCSCQVRRSVTAGQCSDCAPGKRPRACSWQLSSLIAWVPLSCQVRSSVTAGQCSDSAQGMQTTGLLLAAVICDCVFATLMSGTTQRDCWAVLGLRARHADHGLAAGSCHLWLRDCQWGVRSTPTSAPNDALLSHRFARMFYFKLCIPDILLKNTVRKHNLSVEDSNVTQDTENVFEGLIAV